MSNKAKILRVDSDAIEELSEEKFEYFCESLFLKFTAMQHLGFYSCMDFEEIGTMWMQQIVDDSREYPYKTVYYVMSLREYGEDKKALAIVSHEFGLLHNLKSMKLKEFYVLNWDYEDAYKRMKNYLIRNYDYCERTIFHKEAYQRKEHMTMGMMEPIY